MQTVSVVFSTLHCEGYTVDLRYIAGSLLLWSLKSYPPFWKAQGMEDSQEKDYSFLGNDTFPNLYDALVYEWLFWRDKYTSDYFRVNLPSWNVSRIRATKLSKPSTVSEPSIVKFIENQSEHLPKLTLYHLKKCARHARHELSRILLLFLRGLNQKNSMLKKFVFKKISTIEIPKSSKLHRYVNIMRWENFIMHDI